MDAAQFCGEYARELDSGRITFSKKRIEEFITTYTYFSPEDFTKEMRNRLAISVMIDLYKKATEHPFIREPDYEPKKIELPDFIFK